MAAQSTDGYLLGIDYGEARIGLALASAIAKLPAPYKIVQNSDDIYSEIARIIKEEDINSVVIGLPRDQSGRETVQTSKVREFANKLKDNIEIKIFLSDESLSSIRAEEMRKELKDRPLGAHIDDLAACFILEEFLKGNSLEEV